MRSEAAAAALFDCTYEGPTSERWGNGQGLPVQRVTI